jgi:hypothetical protein
MISSSFLESAIKITHHPLALAQNALVVPQKPLLLQHCPSNVPPAHVRTTLDPQVPSTLGIFEVKQAFENVF